MLLSSNNLALSSKCQRAYAGPALGPLGSSASCDPAPADKPSGDIAAQIESAGDSSCDVSLPIRTLGTTWILVLLLPGSWMEPIKYSKLIKSIQSAPLVALEAEEAQARLYFVSPFTNLRLLPHFDRVVRQFREICHGEENTAGAKEKLLALLQHIDDFLQRLTLGISAAHPRQEEWTTPHYRELPALTGSPTRAGSGTEFCSALLVTVQFPRADI